VPAGAPAGKASPPKPGMEATEKPAPVPGADATAQPGAAGPGTLVSEPVIRPPKPNQRVPADELPELPAQSRVPAGGLKKAQEPVYDYDKLVKANLEMRAGRPPVDPKADLPAGGQPVAPSTPTAVYPVEEKGRYVRVEKKITAGTTAQKSWVVRDSLNPTEQYMFKPREAEYRDDGRRIDRAVERGIVEGEPAPREVAGGKVAKKLGYEDAPQGKLATIDGKEGVLIEWKEKNSLADLANKHPDEFRQLIESDEYRQAMVTMDALDYLINNLDRGSNFGNYLYEFEGGHLKLTPIDHALSFTATQERASIEGFTRELPKEYPQELVDNLTKISKDRAAFMDEIRPLVGDTAAKGFEHRLDIMIKDMQSKQAKR